MLVITVLVRKNKSGTNIKKKNDEYENQNQIERNPQKNNNKIIIQLGRKL